MKNKYVPFLLCCFLSVAHGQEKPIQPSSLWMLAYSVEDEFCQHILRRLNTDIIDDGLMSPDDYHEVQAINWTSENRILDLDNKTLMSEAMDQNRVAIADVNNDGKDEIARISERNDPLDPNFDQPAFHYFDISLKNKIFEEGIEIGELNKSSLGDSLNLEDGRERPLGGYFGLVNLPVQNVIRLNRVGDRIGPYEEYAGMHKQYELYPLTYNNVFYMLMMGSMIASYDYVFDYEFDLEKENVVVIRSYNSGNKVSDTCYFLNYSI